MRVGLDGRPLMGRRTGTGRYVFELCRELDLLLPDAQFYVYAPTEVELPTESGRWHCRTEARRWARSLKPIAWLKLRAGRLCREDHLDVFWGSATLFPPLVTGVVYVTTVYDLTFRVAPDTMGRTHRLAHRLFFGRDVRRATRRTAISHGTAQRLTAWLGGPPAAVIPPAVALTFYPRAPEDVAQRLALLGISQPYLLAVGTWEPRKNLELLVRVFLALKLESGFRDLTLVLAGGPGWRDKRLRKLLHGSGNAPVSPGSILPLGFLSDEVLAHLYSGCRAFVFPSRYEGFGLPVLEARACGAVVLATDTPELREAGGNDALYVEATFEGLSDGIRRVMGGPPTQRTPPALNSWRRSAELLAQCFSTSDV